MTVWLKQSIHQTLTEHLLCAKEYVRLQGCRSDSDSRHWVAQKGLHKAFPETLRKAVRSYVTFPFPEKEPGWVG